MNTEYVGLGRASHQRGATLLVAMIMLMLITIVGFSAMQTTTMQERMSGNLRDKELSFQAAEAALRSREAWLADQKSAPTIADDFVEYGTEGSIDLKAVSADPEAKLEEKYFIPDSLDIGHEPKTGVDLYRIEARGRGQSDSSRTDLESTYAKRFN